MKELTILYLVVWISAICSTNPADCKNPCKFRQQNGLHAECSNRHLRDIPQNFPSNTTAIDLSNNEIITVRNSSFKSSSHLESLDLHKNAITHLEPMAFEGCHYLQKLDLSQNQLKMAWSSFPDSVFDMLCNLRWLDLKYNHPGDEGLYPERIFKELKELQVLRIDACGEPRFGEGIGGLTNLKELVLGGDYCNLTTLRNTTFHSLKDTSLEILDISGCRLLSTLEKGTFAPLQKLQELLMGFTGVWVKNALKSLSCFAGRPMRKVNLFKVGYRGQHYGTRYINQTVLDGKDLPYLAQICLRKIVMSRCDLLYINLWSLFNTKFSQCVTHVDVSQNRLYIDFIQYLAVLRTFPNLTILDISFQEHGRTQFPPDLQEYKLLLPYLTNKNHLPLVGPASENSNFTVTLPQNLRYINASAVTSSMGNIAGNIHVLNESLMELNVSFLGIGNIDMQITGLTHLVCVDMSGNPALELSDTYVNTLPSVKILHMSKLSFQQDAMFRQGQQLLKNQHRLEKLHISHNHLSNLPEDLFINNRLLEHLDLSGNVFRSVPLNLKINPKLKILDMRTNSLAFINTLDQRMIDLQAERVNHQFQLLLSGNIFRCDCGSLHFLFWLKETRTWIDNNGNFTCVLGNDDISNTAEEISHINTLWRKCIRVNLLYIASSLMSSLILLLMSVLLVKTNQTAIRCMFENLIRQDIKKPKRGDFKFDLYIAHADHDYRWVCHCMRVALEERGISLFLWERDSIPGESIADQIAENMENSCKILLYFTANFERDPWTYMSLMAAINSVDDNSPERVILLLSEQEQPKLPNCLLEVIPESCILRTSVNDSDDTVLWDNIAALVINNN